MILSCVLVLVILVTSCRGVRARIGVSPRRALSHSPQRAQDLFVFCGSRGYLALKKKKATVTVTMHNTGRTSAQHVEDDKDTNKGVREREMTAMRAASDKKARKAEGGRECVGAGVRSAENDI